jgi:hypothetical protein
MSAPYPEDTDKRILNPVATVVGVVELLKVAKHGTGRRVFLVEFRYVKPQRGKRKAKR